MTEPGSAAMERTEREKLAYRIQGIMSLTLSVEDGEIMRTGQASFQSADILLSAIETLTRERDEWKLAAEQDVPFRQLEARAEKAEAERDALREANKHANHMQRLTMDQRVAAERERDEAREALKPFASECETWADDAPDDYRIKIKLDTKSMMSRLTLADLRRTRAIVKSEEPTT